MLCSRFELMVAMLQMSNNESINFHRKCSLRQQLRLQLCDPNPWHDYQVWCFVPTTISQTKLFSLLVISVYKLIKYAKQVKNALNCRQSVYNSFDNKLPEVTRLLVQWWALVERHQRRQLCPQDQQNQWVFLSLRCLHLHSHSVASVAIIVIIVFIVIVFLTCIRCRLLIRHKKLNVFKT